MARQKQGRHKRIDSRYTIRLEWCGYQEQRYVARYLGDWVGQSLDKSKVEQMAREHNERRFQQ